MSQIPECYQAEVQAKAQEIVDGLATVRTIVPNVTAAQYLEALLKDRSRAVAELNGMKEAWVTEERRVRFLAICEAIRMVETLVAKEEK